MSGSSKLKFRDWVASEQRWKGTDYNSFGKLPTRAVSWHPGATSGFETDQSFLLQGLAAIHARQARTSGEANFCWELAPETDASSNQVPDTEMHGAGHSNKDMSCLNEILDLFDNTFHEANEASSVQSCSSCSSDEDSSSEDDDEELEGTLPGGGDIRSSNNACDADAEVGSQVTFSADTKASLPRCGSSFYRTQELMAELVAGKSVPPDSGNSDSTTQNEASKAIERFIERRRSSQTRRSVPRLHSADDITPVSCAIQLVASPTLTVQNATSQNHPLAKINPNSMLVQLWEKRFGSMTTHQVAVRHDDLPDDFLVPWNQDDIRDYDQNARIFMAVQSGDISALWKIKQEKTRVNWDACNKFGERYIHTAARRQDAEMLDFLVNECGASTGVCCEAGRSPLHDLCFSMNPNFEAVRVLLRINPDLLRIADGRGFCPLNYIPRDTWGAWNDFLEESAALLNPLILISY
jgi:hypothetical protein